MASSAAFCDHVLDLLAPLGGVSARRMFGGFGLYRAGVIFALISEDTLYLKADRGLQAEFEGDGMLQFRPPVRGRRIPMPYFQAPPEMLEEPDALVEIARKALAARAARIRPPASRKPKAAPVRKKPRRRAR